MKKIIENNLYRNYLIIFVFLFSIEIIFRLVSNNNLFTMSLLRIFIGINFISFFLSFIMSWFNYKVTKILIIIIELIATIYAFVQLGFNDFIGVYASFNQTSQLGAVTSYIKDFFMSFNPLYYLILLPFVLLICFYHYKDKKVIISVDKNYRFIKKALISIIVLASIGSLYYYTLVSDLFFDKLQVVNNMELFKYPSHPSLAVNQFGIITYGILDIKTSNSSDFKNYVSNKKHEETMDKITEYLKNNDKTSTNEYTGLFKNKNVIFIMMESVNEIFINKELYPNFYKIYSEGYSFVNHYSPRSSCSTGNTEFSALTSLYTINNNCTCNVYQNNTYFESLFNLFNNSGYNTSSMHNYDDTYYARKVIHPNLGSNKYYSVDDLEIEYDKKNENWASDEDLITKALDITLSKKDNKPFMLYLTSVTSHQPYNVTSIYGDKYLDLFKDTKYPIELQRYMSKLKILDNALGILLKRLKEEKILDNTVIVLFGDHYPYGLKNEMLSNVLDYDLSEYEIERTPFVIYNSKEHPKKIDNYTTYINLTPTIANLFGLKYDSRLYMGSDVLDESYINVATFSDGSWKNKDIYYDASSSKVKNYTEVEYTTDDIVKINTLLKNRMQMSKLIIENNYFEYLNNNLSILEREENK